MKSTSVPEACGSSGRSGRGASVVPRIILPNQGTANSTRPSAVLGTSSAWSPGEKDWSTTTCAPWLGATMGVTGLPAARASYWRNASTQTPVALTMQPAWMRNSRPVSTSRATSPTARPASCSTSTASQ